MAKTILITGTSEGGIGDALAQEFHRKGLHVFATARSLSKIAHLKVMGIDVLPLDVTSEESIAEAASAVAAQNDGKLDYLLNNSGGGYGSAVLDAHVDVAKRMFDVNVFALVTVTRAFMPLLIKARGTVINNTSIVADLPLPFQGLYTASKAAASNLSSVMRQEFKVLGVKVIEIKTGTVKTHFFDNLTGEKQVAIPETSYYRAAGEEVKRAMTGGTAGEKAFMNVDAYAKKVVSDIISNGSSRVIWRGGSASAVHFLSHFANTWMFDLVGAQVVGLAAIEKKLKESSSVS